MQYNNNKSDREHDYRQLKYAAWPIGDYVTIPASLPGIDLHPMQTSTAHSIEPLSLMTAALHTKKKNWLIITTFKKMFI